MGLLKQKVAIFGSAEPSDNEVIKLAETIGALLAKHGHIVITGACGGLPGAAAKAASAHGGKVVGYAPFTNLKDQEDHFEGDCSIFSELKFVPESYEYCKNLSASYKYRNICSTAAANMAIVIGGKFGTLNEFTIAYDLGKPIGLLEGSGEITDIIIRHILPNIKKETGATVEWSSEPEKLLQKMNLMA